MERITHNLVQGSAEWLIYRAAHDNASDAAAMLNCSPYKTRTELLHERWLGMQPEFSQYVQDRVLDKGHSYEKLARPLAEDIMDAELFPVTMSMGTMSASLDGHTFDGRQNWEHKSLNSELSALMVEEFTNGTHLPKFYRVQMEHQFIPSGAEETLFTASKWNGEDLLDIRHAWYFPDYELRAEIVAGWEQFHKDLAIYEPPQAEKPKPAGKRMDQLPTLVVNIRDGKLTDDTNLKAWKDHVLGVIASVNLALNTDEDFATAENMVKWCETVEAGCDTATGYVRSQVIDIDTALKALEDVKAASAKVRNLLKTANTTRKKERKDELVGKAVAAFHKHTADLNATLAPYCLPAIAADFPAQVKGKSKFSNMKNDLDAELARAKIQANELAAKMGANIKALNARPEFLSLFADAGALIQKAPDDLALVIRTRIADHEAELARKAEAAAEAAREKIREEERAKAEAEAAAKVKAERDAQDVRDREAKAEADRQAEAEAAERRRQDDAARQERAQAEEDLKNLETPEPDTTPAERRAETFYSGGGFARAETASAPAMIQAAVAEVAHQIAADQPANVSLGKIAECLGFRLDESFIVEKLGIPWRAKERTARLWSEGDYNMIRAALIKHLRDDMATGYIPF